ncbi:hypothetical protein T01_14849 [Trichinella spiralis]|uniref:Uncharacterized protein n=1 Tax=Trichinella spiralis TaxID=6334 RepID=A0A0V1AHP5_TRISP|nr:hypothetical protein T01_14849 [Trichinella spiralis]
MDWEWVVIDGRIPGVRIVEGVHNTGSSLIMRRKCCEQEYNIELVMEGCGMSEPLLLRGGWSRRKVNQWEWM